MSVLKKRLKILGVLLSIIIVMLFINITLNDYMENKEDILKIIGNDATNSELSLTEYVLLSEKTIGIYLKWVQEEKYEEAYRLLTPEYKEIVSFEEYKTNTQKMDFTSYRVKDIILKTQNMYVAYVEIKDEITHEMLIIMNDDKFAIVPEPFLKYINVGNDITKDKVTYELVGYEIDVNRCVFDMKIINNNNEDIKITSAKIVTENNIVKNANNSEQTIKANSTENISFIIEGEILTPTSFEIERDAGKTIRSYNFKLK